MHKIYRHPGNRSSLYGLTQTRYYNIIRENAVHKIKSALDLAGMDITFFIAPHIVLCFRFVAKRVLITQHTVLAFAE